MRTEPEVELEGEGGRRWRKMRTEPEVEMEGEGGGRWRRTEPDENELEAEYDGGRRWRRRRTEPENILNILTNIQLDEVTVVISKGEWCCGQQLKVDMNESRKKMPQKILDQCSQYSRWRRWQRRVRGEM